MKVGVIGGSGVGRPGDFELVDELVIETPFGKPSAKIKKFKLPGAEFYFIPRHGDGHTISPSEINYRANIYALKSLGVKVLVSLSAVGSLQENLAPGMFFLPDQFIDWTKGKRERSFFDKGMVGHVSCAQPVHKELQARIWSSLKELEIKSEQNGSYICIEGPQFSTKAESQIYRSFGASVIGMTNLPEAYLAKEASMAYATVAMVTDYDCWKEHHCSVEEILQVMGDNVKLVPHFLKHFLPRLLSAPLKEIETSGQAVVSSTEKITAQQKEILQVLFN